MEEQGSVTKITFCYCCFCKNDENSLHLYNIQNEALKAIFQIDHICLCYLCKRRVQQAELFIQNVQTNQLLLENFQNITDSTLEALRTQAQPYPLINLTHIPLDIIELSGNNEDTTIEESLTIVYDSWSSKNDVKVKLEPKYEENDLLDQFDEQFLDDNDEKDSELIEHTVKEEAEDDYPLKLLKEELQLEGINIKCLKKSKKRKVNKKSEKHKDKELKKYWQLRDIRIEVINITREQCMGERAKMVLDKQYTNSVYKCEDCIKGFNFKDSYDRHMGKHSENNGDYECDICKQRFSTADKMNSHLRYHYLRYKCSVCNLTRVSRVTIKDHYTAAHCNGFYQYSCAHCSKDFNRQASLRKHVWSVHKNKERVQCEYCDKSYASKEVLKRHLIVRHPSNVSNINGIRPKRHVCQECGMAFSAPSQLRNHGVKHSQRRDYYCVECDKSFKSDTILKHHLKTAMPHTNYLELPLQCQHCDKRFAIKRDVVRHTNRVHLNIKPFQCDKCERAYVNGWSLNQHRRLVHEGYKRPLKFPCPMCDKVFDRNQILKGHIRTHTGERPYQCSKCPAQFSQASILGTHVKLIHLKLTRDGRPKAVNNVALK